MRHFCCRKKINHLKCEGKRKWLVGNGWEVEAERIHLANIMRKQMGKAGRRKKRTLEDCMRKQKKGKMKREKKKTNLDVLDSWKYGKSKKILFDHSWGIETFKLRISRKQLPNLINENQFSSPTMHLAIYVNFCIPYTLLKLPKFLK